MDTERELPLVALLGGVQAAVRAELHVRLREQGFAEIRPAHGCVFGNIDEEGSRLTDLAERSGLTKQSVGEAVADLEQLGFVERVGDPGDGRAKIIRLTRARRRVGGGRAGRSSPTSSGASRTWSAKRTTRRSERRSRGSRSSHGRRPSGR